MSGDHSPGLEPRAGPGVAGRSSVESSRPTVPSPMGPGSPASRPCSPQGPASLLWGSRGCGGGDEKAGPDRPGITICARQAGVGKGRSALLPPFQQPCSSGNTSQSIITIIIFTGEIIIAALKAAPQPLALLGQLGARCRHGASSPPYPLPPAPAPAPVRTPVGLLRLWARGSPLSLPPASRRPPI